MADLGWMGVIFPKNYGGMAGNFLELIFLLEEMGKALVPGPFVYTTIAGYSLLRHGSEKQKEDILPGLTRGELIIIPCLIAPDAVRGVIKIKEDSSFKDDRYLLSGTRLFVPFARSADYFLFESKTRDGTTLFLIGAENPDIALESIDTLASDKQCELVLDRVPVSPSYVVGEKCKSGPIIKEMQLLGALCESAYILGLLEKALEMAVSHAKSRKQFGRPIGSFQAIQHQCADMATEIDKIKFLTYQAAWKLSENIPADKDIHMAKAKASDASRTVTILSIKIHGGLGISQEYDLQLYFRRAKAAETAFGDGNAHREFVAQSLGL